MNQLKNQELIEAQIRLTNARADRFEFRNKIERGEYIHRDAVNKAYADIVTSVKNKLLGLPAKLAPRLTGETEQVIAWRIKESVVEILNELAEGKLVS
ncbi:MAG: hypothetical protein IJG34_11255 [Synergistaceae bacterium]|nr:hypothetical protein [Synergistaceae bacterium]MBQ3450459.1 hypothetical protein [Synergistaceae bacterium]MBQ3693766.1 hypothetical protein [Synergistaceae bacterium]MBQ9628356.1 hypothetical protein [Synergistaceae bacterium]MBR0069803.1 hypothetical protein [Synergistaceae bacterium]